MRSLEQNLHFQYPSPVQEDRLLANEQSKMKVKMWKSK